MLDDPVDELGLRRVKLDWRLSPIDKRSARFMLETFAAEAGAAGIGRVRVLMSDDDDDFSNVGPANHQMCTTRMANDPRTGPRYGGAYRSTRQRWLGNFAWPTSP